MHALTISMAGILIIAVIYSLFVVDVNSDPFELVPPNWLAAQSLTDEQRNEFDAISHRIHGEKKFYEMVSTIHGKGCFASELIRKGDKIGTILNEFKGYLYVPPDIYFVNHCTQGNTEMRKTEKGKYTWDLFATKDIPKDGEILLNYHNTPKYIAKPGSDWVDDC
jgi:hypothetical protein